MDQSVIKSVIKSRNQFLYTFIQNQKSLKKYLNFHLKNVSFLTKKQKYLENICSLKIEILAHLIYFLRTKILAHSAKNIYSFKIEILIHSNYYYYFFLFFFFLDLPKQKSLKDFFLFILKQESLNYFYTYRK